MRQYYLRMQQQQQQSLLTSSSSSSAPYAKNHRVVEQHYRASSHIFPTTPAGPTRMPQNLATFATRPQQQYPQQRQYQQQQQQQQSALVSYGVRQQQHQQQPSRDAAQNVARHQSSLPSHRFRAASVEKDDKGEEDRLAMMAAVAMTELFSGVTPSPPKDIKESREPSATPTSELTASLAKTELDKPTTASKARSAAMSCENTSPNMDKIDGDDRKRKLLEEQPPLPKKSKQPASPRTPEDDEVRQAVCSSQSFASVESRNPSPGVSYRSYGNGSSYHHHRPPPPSHQHHSNGYHWVATAPTPHSYGVPPAPPQSHRMVDPRFNRDAPFRTSPPPPPPPMSYGVRASPPQQPLPPPPQQQQHYYHHLHHQVSMAPSTQQPQPQLQRTTSSASYEEVMHAASGLPKSLSFRKICSRCGKTRGEHGELGFGNKCLYQDCGKCGADQRWHEAANQSMGISCQLSVAQGAIPGAALAYERKIRDLATRAELQRSLQWRKRREGLSSSSSSMMVTSSTQSASSMPSKFLSKTPAAGTATEAAVPTTVGSTAAATTAVGGPTIVH